MSLKIIEPGLLTLVQGIPYRGQRQFGMPLAGAADPVALAFANWLVSNEAEAPVIETAYGRVEMLANAACTIAIQGAATEIEINGKRYPTYLSHGVARGDKIIIHPARGGCRSYIAIAGGFNIPPLLDATSTYLPARLGGFAGKPLIASVELQSRSTVAHVHERTLPGQYRLHHSLDFLLRVVAAPESDWAASDALASERFKAGRRSDRIGLELLGTTIALLRNAPLDSSAVFPGTIQCPPSGVPYLLGPDAQTTGGYPRIAQVIRADRHLIGQLRAGARVQFVRVEPAKARHLYRSKIALLRQLQPDIRLD